MKTILFAVFMLAGIYISAQVVNVNPDPPLARVSERVQLFSRLLTRSLLYNKLNYIHRDPVIEMIVEKEEDDLFSSARNYADLDSLIEIIRESKLLITY